MSVKNTQEVLYVAKVIVMSVVREIVKDGFQVSDLAAFLKTSEFEVAVAQAVADANLIPGELASLSLMDDLALARYAYNMGMDIVQEVKAYKKSAA